MNHGNYTAIPSEQLAAFLDVSLKGLAAEFEARRPPKLAQVVLGGGYGRGEGGVLHTPQGDKPYNDLDIFVFSDGAGRRERRDTNEEPVMPYEDFNIEPNGETLTNDIISDLDAITK